MEKIVTGSGKKFVSSEKNISQFIGSTYEKMFSKTLYRVLLLILGLPLNIILVIIYLVNKKKDTFLQIKNEIRNQYIIEGYRDKLVEEAKKQAVNKNKFFNKQVSGKSFAKEVDKLVAKNFNEEVLKKAEETMKNKGTERVTFTNTFKTLIANKSFFWFSIIPGFLMYTLILIYSMPYLKYIFERLVMMVFVVFGVTFLVFTILYLSPMDPAANILGQTATKEQINYFNSSYGLDKPYIVQLWNTFKGLITFDIGKSFSGNEPVISAIARKFPVTLNLTVASLAIGIIIAIPSGIISATKQYSFFDYIFMLLALIGLSIPNFWLGLVMILNFSIKQSWLPTTYSPGNWLSLIMPAIVIGTDFAAAIARMTRSSMLEVIHQDYIVTAKAKGLSQRKIILKHALGNALIPIVTVIGLQFGGMLGGSAVTEKVFNISGIGSYIVDKQFIPDIPSILAGVIYVAVTISVVNLFVDVLYSFLDPRIRSKMKNY